MADAVRRDSAIRWRLTGSFPRCRVRALTGWCPVHMFASAVGESYDIYQETQDNSTRMPNPPAAREGYVAGRILTVCISKVRCSVRGNPRTPTGTSQIDENPPPYGAYRRGRRPRGEGIPFYISAPGRVVP